MELRASFVWQLFSPEEFSPIATEELRRALFLSCVSPRLLEVQGGALYCFASKHFISLPEVCNQTESEHDRTETYYHDDSYKGRYARFITNEGVVTRVHRDCI